MSFQGKEFSGDMMQLVVNLKQHYDSEKRSSSFVSTQIPKNLFRGRLMD